jgi:hypothetical protein
MNPDDLRTYAVAWAAERHRVALVICPECGASLLVGAGDDLPDPIALHVAWHNR